MTHTALGRAQLLHILAKLPEAEWPAAARAAGYDPRPARPKAKPARQPAPQAEEKPAAPPPAAQPYRPGDLPDLPFWRIASQRLLTSEERPGAAPAWLESGLVWDQPWVSDPNLTPPASRALTPRARNARFLRQQLVAGGHGDSLDLARLCGLLAERRLPPRLPRLKRASWPGRVTLLLDLAPALRPYHPDFWRWARQLRQTLGQRLTLLIAREGHPEELERAGAPTRLRLDEEPLVILSDAGLNATDELRHRHWREFGRRCARLGVRPLLLAPCPPRRLTAEVAVRFRCVLLEHGGSLRRARCGAATPAPTDAAEPLLAALATGAYTEPPLLRELRLALAGQGADIGSEYAVWNHPGVVADELACALRPALRAEARHAFDRLEPALRAELQRIRDNGNRHLSPLVRLEETLTAGAGQSATAWWEALEQARRYAATLYRAARDAPRHPFAAFISGMGRRRPELLAERPELTLAWGLAYLEQLRAGRLPALPKGVRLQDLAFLIDEEVRHRPVYLGQVGDTLGVYDPAGPGGMPACRLLEVDVGDEYWQVETEAVSASAAPSLQTLHLDTPLALDPEQRYRLTLGRQRLELEAVHRPAWAVGMGRDEAGLFAELAEGRRLYWVPKGMLWVRGLTVRTGSFGEEESKVKTLTGDLAFGLPHGFWWDELEYRAYLEASRALLPPAWASRHGSDDYGYWAEFEVKGVSQRMRWIPPGAFLMGSPEAEPERFADEQQHPVLLTQGTWLADTACTQALWQAVLGESPSNFRGDQRPVEQVSWEDVVERFLPALDRLLPGLDAALPTEAQWEYACRAGTPTPFWFGDNITPEQVNYEGNYPYADGVKGEYREETVEVKALPANGWGLYQMHGNVWEWCSDWLGEYPGEAAVDPTGPSGGRERVLRGGGWIFYGRRCRSASRRGYEPGYRHDYFGFRLARGPSPGPAGSVGVAGVVDGGGAPASAPDSATRGLGQALRSLLGKGRKK